MSQLKNKRKWTFVILMMAILFSSFVSWNIGARPALAATGYYVDCSAASNGAGTQTSPWNSLSSVNRQTFTAGDAIYFKKGTACSGQLMPTGSGTNASPIVVDAYGTGSAPVLNGGGLTESTVYLLNVDYWTVQNLEITNDASAEAKRSGVLVEATDSNVHNGITIQNLTVHNVKGLSDRTKTGRYSSAGILVRVPLSSAPATGSFQTVLINNNNVHDVTCMGIASGSGDAGLIPHTYMTGLTVQNNTIQRAQADAIYIGAADSPLIQYNVGYDQGFTATNVGVIAQMWSSAAKNPTYQYNEAARIVLTNDSQAWDCDWGITGTCTYQYNYSHDNSGGFFLNCSTCATPNSSQTEVLRYNINQGYSRIRDAGAGTAQRVYNNVFYSPNDTITTSNMVFTNNAQVNNNIFVSNSAAALYQGTGTTYDYNLYYGFTPPTDAHKVITDPMFVNPGTGADGRNTVDGYKLLLGSPAIGAGKVISGNGGLDFWGNTVSATAAPNIGAFNGTGTSGSTQIVANAGFESGALSAAWSNTTGTGVSVVNSNAHSGTYAVQLTGSGVGVNQNIVGLKPNTSYTLTGWTKVTTAGDNVAIGVKNFGGTETFQTTTSTGYTQLTVTFTTGATNTTAQIYVWKNSGTSNTYADDFQVVQTNPTNLALNPGFETGSLSSWVSTSGSGTSVVTGNAHSGTYAVQLVGSGVGAHQIVTGLTPNTKYTLTGWAKVSTAGDNVAIGVRDYGGTETFQTTTSTNYTPLSITFTTGATNTSTRIYIWKNSGTSNTYGDDFQLIAN